ASGAAESSRTCKKLGGRCVPSTRCQDVIPKVKCLAGKKCCASQAIAERQLNKKTGKEKLVKGNPMKIKRTNKLKKGKVDKKTKKIKKTNRSKKIKTGKKTRKIKKIKDNVKGTRKIQQVNRNNEGHKDNVKRTRKIQQRNRNNEGDKCNGKRKEKIQERKIKKKGDKG
ncbi:unnamed protein product, partial [Meganyctiphanes norvegica]